MSVKQEGEGKQHFKSKTFMGLVLMTYGYRVAFEVPLIDVTQYCKVKKGEKRFLQPDIIAGNDERTFIVEVDGWNHWTVKGKAKDKWKAERYHERFPLWKIYHINLNYMKKEYEKELLEEVEHIIIKHE